MAMQATELDSEEGIHALDRMLSSIEYVLLEEVEGDLFLAKATPPWFDCLADLGLGRSVMARLPFLESFLPEAHEFWQQAVRDSHIQSDFWTQNNIYGKEVHLLAYALSMNGRRLLLIHPDEELYKEQESYQTYIHEKTLLWKAVRRFTFGRPETPPKLTEDSVLEHKV
ncbi:hypothetical protein GOB94_06700 [Granulicella sp. 5B5]|uniref:hypothetical protein n=1 Tax=Granulicella sp. 5B5 TaxID=1617967 RepID=UPI0015F4DFAF|nr:hypothetical protein [Granulicella sp. 5B5]QMV18407.1 hypothetical protein GOB94_06700 [Granulicella sp. 5B5]